MAEIERIAKAGDSGNWMRIHCADHPAYPAEKDRCGQATTQDRGSRVNPPQILSPLDTIQRREYFTYMPYQQRSTRRVRNHLVTYGNVCRAHGQVCNELVKHGFWTDRMDAIHVYWISSSFYCYGWYQEDIYIPSISGARLSDLFMGRQTRLTDVLRHEWAHALADKWPELIQSKRFERTFGGLYESTARVAEFNPALHLTKYASTSACEDFAEVFHFYIRHRAKIPARLTTMPSIVRKWEFIRWMAHRIAVIR